jgi:DNA-binding LacI/PurR family transcriptional regulator/DNA-binding transcriptional regulator YhcF (GntR family)
MAALEHSLTYLNSNLDSGHWKDGDRLPSLSSLAKAAGVGRSTMWIAVKRLMSKGRLSTQERAGIVAGKTFPAPQVSAAVHASKPWQKKKLLLEKDILSGRYLRGVPLPRSKELQVRYGACAATVRKMLESLAHANIISPHKKSYLVPRLGRWTFGATVVWVGGGYLGPEEPKVPERPLRLMEALEAECAHSGINLEFLHINFYHDDADVRRFCSRKRANPILGFIFDMQWVENQRPELISSIIRLLAADGRSVAILDETSEFSLSGSLIQVPGVKVFRFAALSASRAVARMLLTLGHSHIAYFSYQHKLLWSMQRLQGLQEEFAKAGADQSVAPFTSTEIAGYYEQVWAISGLERKDFERLIAARHDEHLFHTMLDNDSAQADVKVLQRRYAADIKETSKNFRHLLVLEKSGLSREHFYSTRNLFIEIGIQKLYRHQQEALFREAIKRKDITAWVCATDGVALGAYDFLLKKGVDIPGTASITGFDNSSEALSQRITSYDFDTRNVMRTILDFLHRPASQKRKPDPGPEEIEGFIIERESLGKVK